MSHREFIQDVQANDSKTDFAIMNGGLGFGINPGSKSVFPWLHVIANQYDQYRPRAIVFEFRSLSTDIQSASRALGSFIMATEYDAGFDATKVTEKRQLLQMEYASDGKPSVSFRHVVDCTARGTNANNWLNVATDGGGEEPKDYNFVLFMPAVTGKGEDDNRPVLGELWVSYEFEFAKPQGTADASLACHIIGDPARIAADNLLGAPADGWLANQYTLGSVPGKKKGSNMGVVVTPSTGAGSSWMHVHFGTQCRKGDAFLLLLTLKNSNDPNIIIMETSRGAGVCWANAFANASDKYVRSVDPGTLGAPHDATTIAVVVIVLHNDNVFSREGNIVSGSCHVGFRFQIGSGSLGTLSSDLVILRYNTGIASRFSCIP